MGSLGYLKQVISEVTMHFGSSTDGVLKSGWTMNNRVRQATARTKLSSTQIFFHQLTYGLAFYARACGLEFCHNVFHYCAHVFHRR
jgi:hypothetical protein